MAGTPGSSDGPLTAAYAVWDRVGIGSLILDGSLNVELVGVMRDRAETTNGRPETGRP